MNIYIASLYRFGYEITAAGATEQDARETVLANYVKSYKDINDSDPSEDEMSDGTTYLDLAIEDVEIREFTFGEAQWL